MDRFLDTNNDYNDYDENNYISEDDLVFTNQKNTYETIITLGNYQIAPIKNCSPQLIFNKITIFNDLQFIDNIFTTKHNDNIYISIIIIIFSIIIGSLSCLPLSGYQGDIELMSLFDFITCVIRAIFGGLLFIGCWYNSIDNIINKIHNYKQENLYTITDKSIYDKFFKKNKVFFFLIGIIVIFFSSIYALPYTWDYWVSPNTPIKYVSVPLYFASLLQVFYHRTIEQFKLSANTFTGHRKKQILLDSVDRLIINCKIDPQVSNTILEALEDVKIKKHVNDIFFDIKFSYLFTIHENYIFFDEDKEELTELYEDDNYDKFKSARRTGLNVLLGIIYVALLIVLIYQYQNFILDILNYDGNTTQVINDPDVILWISIWISIIESGLFILATYTIHHNYISKFLDFRNWVNIKQNIYKFIIYSPMITSGVILAMTRLQASYISYAILATLLDLRKDMTYFLIVVGMILSFSIEMNFMIKTCIKIINNLIRNIYTSRFFPDFLLHFDCIKNRKNLAAVILHCKKIKNIIESLNDDGIKFLTNNIIQRR